MMSNTKTKRPIALLFLGSFLFQLFSPNISWALTEGPGQPEMTTFQPIGIDNMVDLFSGDFNYNIPLMTVPGPNGGYPVNIHYNSTVGMEQEAGWVGLGWNINVGAVNRVMKGLPDDFKGTPVVKKNNVKTSKSLGLEVDLETELFSVEATDCAPATSATIPARIFYDNMIGVGMNFGFNAPSFLKNDHTQLGANLSFGTNQGLSFSPSVGLFVFNEALTFNLGASLNSRGGVQTANFSTSVSKKIERNKNKDKKDYKLGAGFGFSPISYIPSAQLGFTTFNGTLGTKVGNGSLFSLKAFYTGEASVTVLKDEYKNKTYRAYGYGYSQNVALHEGEEDDKDRLRDELMDFNLEKEGLISKQSPNSANVIPTSDIYSVSSQGFSGTFNHFRNDHGFYYSPVVKSNNYGATVTGDFSSSPDGGEIGTEVGISYSDTYSGPIKGEIFEPEAALSFNGTAGLREGAFYKELNGHNAVQDPADYKRKSDKPNRFKVRQMPSAKVRETIIEETSGEDDNEYDGFTDKIREHANNLLKSYTVSELMNYSSQFLDQSIINSIDLWDIDQTIFEPCDDVTPDPTYTTHNYNKSWSGSYADNAVGGFSNFDPDDQIGAFVGIGSDGMTYEYGIPVYNNYQKEALFSVEYTENGSIQSKTIPYDPDEDADGDEDEGENTNKNKSGDNHFFQSTELPPYAHSHLLTAIYSPDYVDIDNNGPSEADLGYYTKFNYAKAHDDYKWRVPFSGANNMPGYISDDGDNKGSYTYGSKEIYYLKSIETSTHIAVFVLSERADGMEANNENQMADGGTLIGSDALYKLDEIRLFAKSNPCEAIQTVHFEYTYELCEGVPNFNSTYQDAGEDGSGKLTLKRIYTTHYGSYKGAQSPYVFHYPATGTDGNPNYDINQSDHWGTYKQSEYYGYYDNSEEATLSYLGNNNFNPYTNQLSDFNEDGIVDAADINARNNQAAAWLIRKITLPGGGEISVDYEADDYAHVQDEKAKQFYKIAGFSKTITTDRDDRLRDRVNRSNEEAYFVHVELDNDFQNAGEARQYWKNAVQECEDIYFKTYMKLKKPVAQFSPVYDYVNGYANLDLVSFIASQYEEYVYSEGGKWYGIVPIKAHEGSPTNPKLHPMKWAGFNHLRYKRPDLFKHEELDALSIPALLVQLIGLIPETLALFGYINAAKARGWCSKTNLTHTDFPSFLRLHNGDGRKFGGGHRVKQITINDKWSEISHVDENTSTYTLNYSYTLADGKTSSGVASYEPLVGGEENALKEVKHYKASAYSARKQLWLEYPMNENLYPQADVGYSRVVVQSTGTVESQNQFYTEDDLEIDQRLKSAQIVHEFYTYQDFPVKSKQTGRKLKKQFPPVIPIPCFGSLQFSNSIASQGYSIELTDMHGKQEAVKTYHSTADLSNPDIVPYAKTEYVYKQNGDELRNENIPFFHPEDGLTTNGAMGRSVEVATYMNENRMIGTSGSNVDADGTFIAGLPIFSLWVKADYSEAHSRLVTTNKIIRKQGILEKVVTKVGDSKSEALNLAYDKQTGAPVVVKHTNNFEDPVYISSIPAHWHYDDFRATKLTNGYSKSFLVSQIVSADADGVELSEELFETLKLAVGDKVKVSIGSARDLLYVSDINYVDHTINFVNFNGETGSEITALSDLTNPTDRLYIEIIETNKNNQLGTQVGHVVSLNNPLVSNIFGPNWLSALNGAIQTAEPYFGQLITPIGPVCERYAPDEGTLIPNMYCGNFEYQDNCGKAYIGSVILIKENGELKVYCSFTCADDGCGTQEFVLRFSDQLNNPDSDPYHDFSNTYLSIDEDANLFEIQDNENQGNDEYYSGLDLGGTNTLTVKSKLESDTCQTEVLQASAITLSDQWDYHYDLNRITDHVTLTAIEDNPYLYGKRGNYRVEQNYVYQTERKQTDGDSHLDKDGIFKYHPFRWCQDFEDGCDVETLNPDWTKASTITQYDAFNHALEERNALDISSTVLFSRDQNYVIAAAQNARYREIAFEDFEALNAGPDSYEPGNHFNLSTSAEITAEESHTGKQSMKLDNTNNNLQINYQPAGDNPDMFTPVWNFATEKKYLLSFWIKTENIFDITVSAESLDVMLLLDGTSIEGWQKVEAVLTQDSFILFDVININFSGSDAYLDDIRIHPFECGIETYVYDYVRQRNVAVLDNQNYATFYNYDEQGGLTQVKKETVKGVLTLQTSRSHIRKHQ